MPKVELHRHLEGSLRLETILHVAKEFGVGLPTTDVERLKEIGFAIRPMMSLPEVLGKFDLACTCFAGHNAIEYITYSACKDAAIENIKLLELRFSPDYIAQKHGHDFDMMLNAVKKGIENAMRDFDIYVGIIIICSRDLGFESFEKTVNFAIERKNDIIGIDLAGNEVSLPDGTSGLFEKAKNEGLKITVHAGEVAGPESIYTAINELGADRIGHGVQIISDSNLINHVINKDILLEQSPTSNYITRAVCSIEAHPLKKLFDMGVKVGINSDDPGTFDIDLSNEYLVCHEKLGMSPAEIQKTVLYSLDASFVNDSVKKAIQEKYFKG